MTIDIVAGRRLEFERSARPASLAVDLPDTVCGPIGHGLDHEKVLEIRLAQHSLKPPVCRLVVNLREMVPHEVEPTRTGLRVILHTLATGSTKGSSASASLSATLELSAQPGGAEFYIDDEFKGTTSSVGGIKVVNLGPGEHRLRVTRKGYQEWNRTVTLAAGESRTVEVQLQEAIPETALSLADVLKLLEGGVTPVRVETIVRERGVTFTLTDDAEAKLRALGATDTLLLAIAKAKK